MTGVPAASRDVVRSLFGIAVALGLAAVLVREIHEVPLSYDSPAFVWFVSWFAGGLSVAASLADAARTRRQRSLYFAAAVIAGQLLAFQDEMDDEVAFLLAGILWALLAAVIVTEAWSLLRSGPPPDGPTVLGLRAAREAGNAGSCSPPHQLPANPNAVLRNTFVHAGLSVAVPFRPKAVWSRNLMSCRAMVLLSLLAACAQTPGATSQTPDAVESGSRPECSGKPEIWQVTPALASFETLDAEFIADAFYTPTTADLSRSGRGWIDAHRLRAVVVGSRPTHETPGRPGGVCLATSPPIEPPATLRSGRIHRVLALRHGRTGSTVAVVLHADLPPAGLLSDNHAAVWRLSLMDSEYTVTASTSFTTTIPLDRTWDVVETSLALDGALLGVGIRYGLDCDGHKYDQTFFVSVEFDADPACLELRRVEHEGFT